jgi:hypothetical protein
MLAPALGLPRPGALEVIDAALSPRLRDGVLDLDESLELELVEEGVERAFAGYEGRHSDSSTVSW